MNMKATYNLRRLLDERGVEWWSQRFPDDDDSTMVTYWNGFIEGEPWGVWELWDFDGRLFIEFNNDRDFPITPEQAIEATLGRGTCHRRPHINLTIGDNFLKQSGWDCSECGCRLDLPVIARYCPNCGRKVVSA